MSSFYLIPILDGATFGEQQVWAEQHFMWCILHSKDDVSMRKAKDRHMLVFVSDSDAIMYKFSIDSDEIVNWARDEYYARKMR